MSPKGEVAYMRDKSELAKAYIGSPSGRVPATQRGAILPLLDGNW